MKKFFLSAALIALATAPAMSARSSFGPFLSFSEMNGTYQGSGWVNSKFLAGCHVIEDEGPQESCSIATDAVNVRQTPRGRVIGALAKSVPIYVNDRRNNWASVGTVCDKNLVPQTYLSAQPEIAIFACEKDVADVAPAAPPRPHADEDVWFCTGDGDTAVAVNLTKMEATLYPGGFYGGPRRATVKIKRTGFGSYAFAGYAVMYAEENRELTRPTRPEVKCEPR